MTEGFEVMLAIRASESCTQQYFQHVRYGKAKHFFSLREAEKEATELCPPVYPPVYMLPLKKVASNGPWEQEVRKNFANDCYISRNEISMSQLNVHSLLKS